MLLFCHLFIFQVLFYFSNNTATSVNALVVALGLFSVVAGVDASVSVEVVALLYVNRKVTWPIDLM